MFRVVFAVSLTATVLNTIKPFVTDDVDFYAYACHFAEAPLDPYGFTHHGDPANEVLLPPVVPYWLALTANRVGDAYWLCKLSMFPFVFLFAFALYRLFERFAPGQASAWTCLTVLSPTFLPSINLMIDVPCLALGLTAIVIFLRGCDRESVTLAGMAGLLTGVAMQAKYTAFVVPGVFLAYGITHRRMTNALIAGALAVTVFIGWEWLMAALYGKSHFVNAFQQRSGNTFKRGIRLVLPFVAFMAGVAPILTLIALRILGWSVRSTSMVAGIMLASLAAIAFLPERWAIYGRGSQPGGSGLTLNAILVAVLGTVSIASTLGVLLKLSREDGKSPTLRFLLLWLILEGIGYFALSPFSAVRRIMGIYIAASLLLARAVALRQPGKEPIPMQGYVIAGVGLGLLFFAVDYREGVCERDLLRDSVAWIRTQDRESKISYVGSWGFAFYAKREGLDWQTGWPWLIVESRALASLDPAKLSGYVQVGTVEEWDGFPLQLQPGFYGGRTTLEHQEGPRRVAYIYRRIAEE